VVAHTAPARLPPDGLEGLDPAWSTLIRVPRTDGVGRTWHMLDNQVRDPQLTLLCVHGNPSWSYLYRDLVGRAPAGVRVIAVDQLEMGFSERSGVARRVAGRIDELSALTDELGVDGPVVTVGHDWGGPVSLGWAQCHREQLAGVVLMNTAVGQPAGFAAPRLIRLARSRPVLRNSTVRSTAFIDGALALSRRRPGAGTRRGFLAPYRSPSRRSAIAGFVIDIPFEPDHPSADVLRAVADGLDGMRRVPVLLLWGSADLVFSDLYLHDLERRLSHAVVHRYPTAGHFVSEDVDAIGAIVDWIGTLDRRAEASEPEGRPSSLLDTHGEMGDQTAVVELTGDGATAIAFGDFAARVDRTAARLARAGVSPGDRVALMIPPGIDLAVSLHACWRAGAVIVLVDSGLGPTGMSAAMRAADPAHLLARPPVLAAARALRWPGRRIGTNALGSALRRLLGAVDERASKGRADAPLPAAPTTDSVAAVVFTSGATGPSKGVVYTHGQLEAQRRVLTKLYGVTPQDRLVAAFAPFALYGPGAGIASVVPNMDVAAPRTLTARALGDAAIAVDATLVFASPGALANVVRTSHGLTDEHAAAFARVRLLLSAGAPVRPSLLRAAADLFPNATAHTPYGMTECLPVSSISLSEIDAASGGDGVCVGLPAPGVDVRVRRLDALGRPIGELLATPDVVGEVVVRAAHARQGYDRLWHTEFAASQPLGWHATGDVGHLDHAGRLWIGGRLAHVISTVDGPRAPVRLEQAIESIDGVSSAAAVGIGPRGAQQIVVLAEPVAPPSSPRLAAFDLVDAVRAAIDEDVVAVFELPQLPVDRRHSSKIDRRRLAAWAEDVLGGGRLRKL
jgi:cis-3-alkyl-4-acyloxetan-2-one decarboxylase / olefin beta-lactone synthetase